MTHTSEPDTNVGAESLLRLPAVVRMTGLAKSTIYKHVALNQFPSPVSLVGRAVAWRLSEIIRWNQDRPALNSKHDTLGAREPRTPEPVSRFR